MGVKNLLADPALDIGPQAVEAGLPKVVQQRLMQVRISILLAIQVLPQVRLMVSGTRIISQLECLWRLV